MAKAFNELLNWYGLIDEGVVQCKDGSLIAGWYLEGIDTEPMDPESIYNRTELLSHSIKEFREEDGFWVDLARRPLRTYKTSEKDFEPEILQIFEAEREEYFEQEDANYANRITLCYHWKPRKVSDNIEEMLGLFVKKCRLVETRFGSLFNLTRMGLRRDIDDHHEIPYDRDELLGRLASGLSGRFCKVNVPNIPVYLDRILCPEWVHSEPKSLPYVSGRPMAVITIDGYPNVSSPEMLKLLETLPIEYQWTTRFLPMAKNKALYEIDRKSKAWGMSKSGLMAGFSKEEDPKKVNSHAENMSDETSGATDELEENSMSFGDFTSVVTIFGDSGLSEETLTEITTEIVEELSQNGFTARRETFNALEAFLSAQPGHRKQNIRRGIFSALSFADLIPISTIWSGLSVNPCNKFPANSPALIRAKSITGEPYFLNLHSGDVGHTLLFGPTGAGKSVCLGLIASNFLKYPNAQVFVFDKKNSMYGLTRAIGGTHIDLSPGDADLNPLGAIDRLGTPWALKWIEKICILSGVAITPGIRTEITNTLSTLNRNSSDILEEFYASVQIDDVKQSIAPYVSGGGFENIINGKTDRLELSKFTVFEADGLLKTGSHIAVPVLDYIFESIEQRLTGAPALIIIDEAKSFLDHPLFEERIDTWTRELRKANTSLVMATQFTGDALQTGLSDALLQSCKTRIFLPNEEAKATKVSDKYRELGLSDTQIDLLATLKPKQDYYVIKPEGRRIIDFCIGEKALKIIGATDVEDSQKFKTLWKKDPDHWWRDVLEGQL